MAIQVRASRLTVFLSRMVSFDIRQRSAAFDFSFTRLFGVESPHEPAPIRVHAVILPARGEEALHSAVAFSFPLCGSSDRDWTLDSAFETLRSQAVEFSQHMGDPEITAMLDHFWGLAHFFATGSADSAGHNYTPSK
ncbi:hypothetical protein L7F22_037770 [Adiantum nelumboides]|nr:hypothetical protein [Adiantum nelumboides]